jgi:hypothetical protein
MDRLLLDAPLPKSKTSLGPVRDALLLYQRERMFETTREV